MLLPAPAALMPAACGLLLGLLAWRLTLAEAVDALGGRLSRSTLERAISAAELPARRGRGRSGKPCLLVERDDLLRWFARREAGDAPNGTHGADDDDDDDDDDVLTITERAAAARMEDLLAGLHRAGLAEFARQMQPLQERLESASLRLGRAEGERDALRVRALAAEDEVRRLRTRVEALERALAALERRRDGGLLRRIFGA